MSIIVPLLLMPSWALAILCRWPGSHPARVPLARVSTGPGPGPGAPGPSRPGSHLPRVPPGPHPPRGPPHPGPKN